MSLLYGRQIEVHIAGFVIRQLRVAFNLEREIDKVQDKGQVSIYNLNDEHEERIYQRGREIQLIAGYPTTAAIIFQGNVQRIHRAREGLAKITKISLGDHVRKNTVLGGVYDRSWEGPVPVRDIAADIIRQGLKLSPGPLGAIPADATFVNFYWGAQSAAVALSRLLDSVECVWFEQDGVVRINSVGSLQSDAPSIVVSPQTGLIDVPIATDEGAECRMFLNPAVRLGCLLTIEARVLSGRYKVVAVKHTGDNWQGKFETLCDLRPVATGQGSFT